MMHVIRIESEGIGVTMKWGQFLVRLVALMLRGVLSSSAEREDEGGAVDSLASGGITARALAP